MIYSGISIGFGSVDFHMMTQKHLIRNFDCLKIFICENFAYSRNSQQNTAGNSLYKPKVFLVSGLLDNRGFVVKLYRLICACYWYCSSSSRSWQTKIIHPAAMQIFRNKSENKEQTEENSSLQPTHDLLKKKLICILSVKLILKEIERHEQAWIFESL